MASDNDVLDPEVVDDGPNAIALRNPSVPVTLIELAARKGEAIEIIDARVQVLNTARLAAVRMTHPEDWVLFKSKDDRITGYLEDAGCERVRPIFGISIVDVQEPQKIMANDGKAFAIIVRGRGRSGLTLDELDAVEGIRESTEDFCKDLTGIKQELRVRQAARANLDGRVVRELTGLGSVPVEELTRAWKGTDKKVEHCRKGRGFGSQDERHGAAREGVPDVPPPNCPVCNIALVYRAGKDGRKPFYGCKNYDKHPQRKVIVDAADWIAQQGKAKTEPPQAAAPTSTSEAAPAPAQPAAAPQALHADDIFGRVPGEEG